MYITLAAVFRIHASEPMTSYEVVEELRRHGIYVKEPVLRYCAGGPNACVVFISHIREKYLDSLVGFGSLKKKLFPGEEHRPVYWTKKLFSIPENEEVMYVSLHSQFDKV